MVEVKWVRACLPLIMSAYCHEEVSRKSFVTMSSRTGLEGRISYPAKGS